MTTPQRTAIYARISNDTEGSAAGVGRQVHDCRAHAERLGWPVIGEYVDNDVSAYSGRRRPEYERLLDDIAEGHVDALIVWHQDRLHRRPVELEHFFTVIDRAGIAANVKTVTGNSDFGTGDGVFTARLIGAVAAKESSDKSRRMQRKYEQDAAEGKPHRGSNRPYGYLSDSVTIDPDEAATLTAIVERFLAGESTRSIAIWLNDEGHRTVRGSQWQTSTLRGMLLNPRYAGLRAHRGVVVGPGQWDPIITEDTHRKIQAAFAEKKLSGRRAPQRYLLSGLLRCGKCTTRLYSTPSGGRRRYGCVSGPDHGGCGRLFVSAEPLEVLIADAVLYRLDSPELADALSGRDSTDERVRLMAAELDDLHQRRDDLARAHGEGLIDMAEWLVAKRPINDKIDHTSRALARATKATALAGLVGTGDQIRTAWSGLNLDRQHAIVKTVLDHAVIGPGRAGVHTVELDRVTPIWRV